MSASLVGSEMCIRDSSATRQRQGLRHRPSAIEAASKRPTARENGRWGSPVSYTHLTLPTICSV
eukprot:12448539-Alexandrium_andersonii.AAC.1